ncbi:hypothetical protein BGX26_005495 [Mortierella sp. AD094]|nr:hypothetical protein BGX26_005495 [Mortierella sp. AD094]
MDDQPIGSQLSAYRLILNDIKNATTHLKSPAMNSPDLKDVDIEHYELCLDLGEPYFILFPKNPDTHKTLSSMHANKMPESSKSVLDPYLYDLSCMFGCFNLKYVDGYHGYGLDYELDLDRRQDSDDDQTDSEYNRFDWDRRWRSDDGWSDDDSNHAGDWDYAACSNDDCGMCGKCDY